MVVGQHTVAGSRGILDQRLDLAVLEDEADVAIAVLLHADDALKWPVVTHTHTHSIILNNINNEIKMQFFFLFFCVPLLCLWGSPFWVRFLRMWLFLNPTIEIVPFRLREWCILGVILLLTFTSLAHECQDLWSPCARMHVCTDYTSIYTLICKFLGNGVRIHVNSKGKIPSTRKILPRGGSNPQRCITQDTTNKLFWLLTAVLDFLYDLFTAIRTVSNMDSQVASKQYVNHMHMHFNWLSSAILSNTDLQCISPQEKTGKDSVIHSSTLDFNNTSALLKYRSDQEDKDYGTKCKYNKHTDMAETDCKCRVWHHHMAMDMGSQPNTLPTELFWLQTGFDMNKSAETPAIPKWTTDSFRYSPINIFYLEKWWPQLCLTK